jgi:hypothetical protein
MTGFDGLVPHQPVLRRSSRRAMILYHGTSSKHLEAIRREGLQPRRATKRRSNWKGDIRSKLDFVYLTTAYPVYFAMNPALGKSRADLLIVRVEVDEAQLYPDEDFIAWAMAKNDGGLRAEELLPHIDPTEFKDHWRESLEANGLVCTPAVPPGSILDHRTISRKSVQLILSIGGDAMPTPLNYRIMGSFYRRCIETLFEHGEEAALEVARDRSLRAG